MMASVIQWFYWFGVDFCINMANMLGATYDEFNIFFFLLFLPLILVILTILNVVKSMARPGGRKT